MVEKDFVEKFNNIFSKIKKEKGEMFLFMIMKTDEISDKWSVDISASWIDLNQKSDVFAYLTNLIKENLNSDELSIIARIGIYEPGSTLVKLITEKYIIKEGINRIPEQNINGFLIHDAYIFQSFAPGNLNGIKEKTSESHQDLGDSDEGSISGELSKKEDK